MEFCEAIIATPLIIKQLESDLKNATLTLHSLGIIHFDIKPRNLMYSKEYKKYVFIDFGLSMIIEEKLGYKSMTFFRGNLLYASAEMFQVYLDN